MSETVNVILRDDYEGLEIHTAYGQSTEFSDAEEYRAGVTWGTNIADGRGNVMLSAEFTRQEGLPGVQR